MAPAQELESVVPAESAIPVPTPDEIAALAYELWQQRGCPEGSPDVDWLRAEAELLARRS